MFQLRILLPFYVLLQGHFRVLANSTIVLPANCSLSLSLSLSLTMACPTTFALFILISLILLQPRTALQYPEELISGLEQNLVALNSPTMSPSEPPNPQISPTVNSSSPIVPALFVIGDSSVDCGTNNFLGTFARADRLPYGRDFDTHQPTGRFCNGRVPVDYLGISRFLDFLFGF